MVYIFISYSCLNHYYNRGYRMLIFLIPSFLLLLHSFSLIYLFFQCIIYIYVVLIFNITMDSQIIYSFSYIVWFCFFAQIISNLASGHPFKPILHSFDINTFIFEHFLLSGPIKYSMLILPFLLQSWIQPHFWKD